MRQDRGTLSACTRRVSLLSPGSATSTWLASSTPYLTYIMADPKKQEKDFTKEVDELLPLARSLAQVRL